MMPARSWPVEPEHCNDAEEDDIHTGTMGMAPCAGNTRARVWRWRNNTRLIHIHHTHTHSHPWLHHSVRVHTSRKPGRWRTACCIMGIHRCSVRSGVHFVRVWSLPRGLDLRIGVALSHRIRLLLECDLGYLGLPLIDWSPVLEVTNPQIGQVRARTFGQMVKWSRRPYRSWEGLGLIASPATLLGFYTLFTLPWCPMSECYVVEFGGHIAGT
ncbi:hypothetical protein K503DRAFT_631580 [Rhizopogon vinicolor AM-OR11-026]|uniref:Uncharacterized protein n=1 Tax=Rhizopogon vinicolor AM-OR11-026 TaxID=1314800 RepID=A0A1B7N600_9AGAM|nr:hypothetical protein K503DRAFT_631580 [Rhizopogon vinicolor AM-OR11-026]